MEWDRDNRWALHRALRAKKRALGLTVGEFFSFSNPPETEFPTWQGFLDSFGIVRVERDGEGGPWTMVDPRDQVFVDGDFHIRFPVPPFVNADSNSHVIVEDPFFPLYLHRGIKIPKKVAMKFLLLGIP